MSGLRESYTRGGWWRWKFRNVLPVALLLMSLQRQAVLSCSNSNCVVVLTDSQGTFTSPCYPQDYPNSQSCKWTLQAPAGFIVQITFLDFELEEALGCIYDRVIVNTGNQDVKFCGLTANGLMLNSTGNVMEISFNSDFSVQKKGFNVMYRQVAVALRNQKVAVSNSASKVVQVSNSVTIPTLQQFTVCFEIARPSQKSKETIFSYTRQEDISGVEALSFGNDQNGMALVMSNETCLIDSILNTSDFTSTMKPFCLTWASTTGKVTIYYNSNYRAKTCSNTIGHSVGAGGHFRLGSHSSFDGTIYNFRLWDYAMGMTQLVALTCDAVGNVIDWDNSFWDIPSSLAQTDSTLSCSTSVPVYTSQTTSCASPGLGCPVLSATTSSATTTSMPLTTSSTTVQTTTTTTTAATTNVQTLPSTTTVTQTIIPSAAAATNTTLFYSTTNALTASATTIVSNPATTNLPTTNNTVHVTTTPPFSPTTNLPANITTTLGKTHQLLLVWLLSEATTTPPSSTNMSPTTMSTNIITLEKERAVYLWSVLRLTPWPVTSSTTTTPHTRPHVLPGPRSSKTSLGYISTPLIWPVRKKPEASVTRLPVRPILYLTKPHPVPAAHMSLRPKVTTITTTAPVARKTHAVSRVMTSPQGLFPWRPVDVGNSSDEEDVESFPAAASASLSNRKKNKPMAPPHWIPLSPSRENSSSSTVNWTEPLEEYTSGSETFIYDLDLGDDPFSLFQYDSSYSLDEGLALATSGPQNLSQAGAGVSTEGPGRVTVSDPVNAGGGREHLHNQSEPNLPQEALAGGALAEAGGEARTGEQGGVVAAHSSWAQIPPFSTAPERTGVQTDQARPGSSFSEQTAERTTQSLSNIATQSPSLLTAAELRFSERVGITTDNDPTVEVSRHKDYTPTPSPISIPTTSAMPDSLWTDVITEIPAPNSLPFTPTIPLPTSPVHSMEQSDVSHSGHVKPAATETETSLPESSKANVLQPSMEVQRHLLMREGTRPRPLSLSVPTDAATALTPVLEKTHLSFSDKHHSDLVLRNQLSSFLTNAHPVDGRLATMVPSESIASESGSQSEGIRLYSPLALEPSSYMYIYVSDSLLGSSEGHEGFNPLSSNLRSSSCTSHLSVTPITEQPHHQALLPATMTDEWTSSQSSPPNTISPSRQEWMDVLPTKFSMVSLSSDLLSETDLPEQLHITTVTEWESADGMARHSARQKGEEVHMSSISGSSSSPSLISLFRPSTQSEPSVAKLGHHGTSHINDDGSEYLSQTSLLLCSSLLAPSPPLALPTPLISSTASEYGSVVTHEPQRQAYMHELGWPHPVSGLGSVIHTDTHTPVSELLSTVTSRADQLMSDSSESLLFHRPMTTNPPRIGERPLPAPTPTPFPPHIPPLRGTLSAGAANMVDSGAGASLPTRPTAAFQQSSTLIGSQSEPTQPAGIDRTLAWPGESRESTASPAAPDTQLTAAASSNLTISAASIQPTVFLNIQSTSTSTSQPPTALNAYPAGAGPVSVPWRANHSEDTQGDKHGPALIDHTPSTAASTSVSSVGPGNNVTVNQNTNIYRETETQTTPNPLAVIGMDEQSFVATKSPYLPLTTPHRVLNAGSGTVSTPRTSAGTAGTPVIAPCQYLVFFFCFSIAEGLFYRISFVVNDKEAQVTESDVEKTVAQWLNQTFQNWTHVVYVDNVSIQPNSDSQLKRSVSKKYTCQALLVYQTTTNVTLGEVAISTRMVGSGPIIGNGLELDTVAVQSVENCPEETPLHYIWPESRPTVTQYVPCFPNKDQNTSRTCVISPLNYTAFWGAPDLSNCTDIDSINVSAENAAKVADQLADITNNELSTEEVSKVVDKVKELVNVAKINAPLATTVLNIISNVMTSSVSALAVALKRTLMTMDELIQKIEFDGPSVSITSKNLALGISALNHSEFNGTSFSAFMQPNTTDLQIDFESNQLNPLAQVTLPATLLKNLTLTDAETAAISRISFMFFSKTGLFQDKQDGLSLNSYVVASSVGNYSISNLQDPVEIEIVHLNYQVVYPPSSSHLYMKSFIPKRYISIFRNVGKLAFIV
ncbi:unnamed protein product [Coregonus sp. 'balchen']|nr:unnamed protein product [Coregonus sp. 'balchen']